MKRQLIFPLLAVVLLIALGTGCSSSTSSSSNPTIVKSEKAAAHAQRVHYVDATTVLGKKETFTGDVGPSQAQEVLLTGQSKTLEIRLTHNTIYVNISSPALITQILGVSRETAKKGAYQWISISESDSPFANIAKSLTLEALCATYYPNGPSVEILPNRIIDGISVTPATSTTMMQNTTVKRTMFINATTLLPQTAKLSAGIGSQRELKIAKFSRWGLSFQVPTPEHSISLETLQNS